VRLYDQNSWRVRDIYFQPKTIPGEPFTSIRVTEISRFISDVDPVTEEKGFAHVHLTHKGYLLS
jgi:hypothetical protein